MKDDDSGNIVPTRWERLSIFFKGVWIRDWFDPNAGFLHLKSFWFPTVVIILAFILLCIKVVIDENLMFGFAKLEDMYQWFKIPLWWLALLIPVLGLLNANHKSEQTRAQIELTRSQNNFANYYKHLEEFSKHCAAIEKKGSVSIDHRALHNFLFMNMRKGDPIIPKEICEQIFNIASNSKQLIDEIAAYNQAKAGNTIALSKLMAEQLFMQKAAGINVRLGKYVKVEGKSGNSGPVERTATVFDPKLLEFITEIHFQLLAFKSAMEFDPQINPLIFDPINEIPFSLRAAIHCNPNIG